MDKFCHEGYYLYGHARIETLTPAIDHSYVSVPAFSFQLS